MLLLSRSWKKQEANKILSITLFCFLILFLTYTSLYLNWVTLTSIISPIGFIIPFALGPCIHHYIKTTYTSKIDLRKLKQSLAPFIFSILIYSIPQYLFGMTLNDKHMLFKIISILIPFLGILHLAYSLFLSHKLLNRYKKLVKNNYSNISTLDLKWLSIWIFGFILFLIIDLLSGLLILKYPIYSILAYTNLFYLILLIWYIGYQGINQTSVFLIEELTLRPIKVGVPKGNKNKSTPTFNCESEEFTKLKSHLEAVFIQQKLFKKQNLSLKETADILNISDKKLSYLLNICLSSNFYEYVNTFRVNYFIKKLEDGEGEKFTILAIAFESGFNSKATFNRVFKQQIGITPIKFKKHLLKRSQSFH